jgi:hypothetical protein
MHWECSEEVLTEDGYTENYEVCEEISLEKIANGLISMKNSPFIRWTDRPNCPDNGLAFNSVWRVWSKLIEEYTSRNMTYQSDKLPALSGVISALQKLTGDTCIAGIWKSWFLHGLLWRLQVPDLDKYVFFPKTPQRAVPWRAPTWSFASVEGVVLYLIFDEDPSGQTCAELLDCDVTPKGINPLGELTSGFAKIKAPVAAIVHVLPALSINGRECRISMTENRVAEAGVYFDFDTYDSCKVLMITLHAGLAIVPVDIAEGTYARVGVVSVYRVYRPESEGLAYMNRDRSLSASHYPSPTIVTLL